MIGWLKMRNQYPGPRNPNLVIRFLYYKLLFYPAFLAFLASLAFTPITGLDS